MQYSQEHLKTMVYAEFGGQTECIMGNSKIENSRGAMGRGKGSAGRIMGRLKIRKGTWVGSTCKANQLRRDYSRNSKKKQNKTKNTLWLKAELLLCEWFKPRGNVTSRLWKGSSVGMNAAPEETVCVSDFLMRVHVRRDERLFGDTICNGPIRLHCSPLSTFWTTEHGTTYPDNTCVHTYFLRIWPANQEQFALFPWLPVWSLSHLDLSLLFLVSSPTSQ